MCQPVVQRIESLNVCRDAATAFGTLVIDLTSLRFSVETQHFEYVVVEVLELLCLPQLCEPSLPSKKNSDISPPLDPAERGFW
jgi:hypothetical protein